MLVADVLVTDYSSAIYEFALLGRPIAFLAPDGDAYGGERGFYLDFPADLPGPVFATTAELAAAIRADAFDVARVEAFAKASFDVVDGHSTARIVDEVIVPALRGRAAARRLGRAPRARRPPPPRPPRPCAAATRPTRRTPPRSRATARAGRRG